MNLEKQLQQLRRIEEHREEESEKAIRKTYKAIKRHLEEFLGTVYANHAEDDALSFEMLQRQGYYARFLEEIEQKLEGLTPEIKQELKKLVEEIYTTAYNGLVDITESAVDADDLKTKLAGMHIQPQVAKSAVENPIAGLTLVDTLERNRKEIIYNIKKSINVGLMNGDRMSTMAKRIAESLNGDYKKAIRIARTEVHRVREAGHLDSVKDQNQELQKAGLIYVKTWKTRKDERVRPKGQKKKKYNHVKMEGVTIPVEDDFILPSGAKGSAPGQTGVAGEDINCRCYLSYDLVEESSLVKSADKVEKSREKGIMKERTPAGGLDPGSDEAEAHAKKYYEAVRRHKGDAKAIARNTGMKAEDVERIRRFLFIEKHDLGTSGIRTFFPSYSIAESWRRLCEGKNIQKHDLTLLRHEIEEQRLMSLGYSQDEAHRIATEKYNYGKESSEYYDKTKKYKAGGEAD